MKLPPFLGLKSRRAQNLLICVAKTGNSNFVTFNMPPGLKYRPQFHGLFDRAIGEDRDTLEIWGYKLNENKKMEEDQILGKIEFSKMTLDEICPDDSPLELSSDQKLEEDEAVEEDETSESDAPADYSLESEEASVHEPDDDFIAKTWQEKIDSCPDEFAHQMLTREMVLQTDRQQHNFILKRLTLCFKKPVQSESNVKAIKKGKR